MHLNKLAQFIGVVSVLICGFLLVSDRVAQAKSIDAPQEMTKDDVGLNVHWALGGFGVDDVFEQQLIDSRTRWAREHFYYEVLMGEHQDAWLARYDKIVARYKQLGIHVVGMLAYGSTHNDFHRPSDADWQKFVELVSTRYGDTVKVWEVWNEPDSPDFLQPHDPWNFKPIMTVAYDTIKATHPDAVVLNGGLSSAHVDFAETMLRAYGDKIDAVNVHLYQCGYYFQDGNFGRLDREMEAFRSVVEKYKPGTSVWVTEFGCSNATPGVHVSDEMQRDYLARGVFHLLQKGWIERVFLYTIRNRDIHNAYEDNFGLLRLDMTPEPAWDFYQGITVGPYGKPRLSVAREAEAATALRSQLDPFIAGGYIVIGASQWPTLVNAFVYGGYPLEAIVAAVLPGADGKTVHPMISHGAWKQTDQYQQYIQAGIELRERVSPRPRVVVMPRREINPQIARVFEFAATEKLMPRVDMFEANKKRISLADFAGVVARFD